MKFYTCYLKDFLIENETAWLCFYYTHLFLAEYYIKLQQKSKANEKLRLLKKLVWDKFETLIVQNQTPTEF